MGVLLPFSNQLNPIRSVPLAEARVDWRHPLTRNLIGCWLPGVSRGVNLAGHSPDLLPDSGTQVTRSTHEGPGHGPSTSNDTGLIETAPTRFKAFDAATVYWRGVHFFSATQNPVYLSVSYSNTLASPFDVLAIRGATSNAFAVWNNGTAQVAAANVALTDGAPVSMCVTARVNGNVIFYKDAISQNTTAWGTATQSNSTANSKISINQWVSGAAGFRSANSICTIALIWDRELSAEEVRMLDFMPYALLVPDQSEMIVMGTGAAAIAARQRLALLGVS